MESGKIRLALVGLGEIAHSKHMPALAGSSRFALAATVDPRTDQGLSGVPHFATLADLVADRLALDAVALCTPPGMRLALAETAIDAGLAVLLEKPPAPSLSAAMRIAARAHAAGVSLFATWHSREAAGVSPARDWLAGRTIQSVRVDWREDVRQWHPGQEWLLDTGGFGAFDPGINALSILTAILPEPLVVETCHLQVPANRQMPVATILRMRHGIAPAVARFDILHEGAPEWVIAIATEAGELLLEHGGNSLTIAGTNVPCPAEAEYSQLYARFAELIATGCSEADLAPLMLVTDAMFTASRETVAPFHF